MVLRVRPIFNPHHRAWRVNPPARGSPVALESREYVKDCLIPEQSMEFFTEFIGSSHFRTSSQTHHFSLQYLQTRIFLWYLSLSRRKFSAVEVMAQICQVSGKKGKTTAKFIRNRHSQGWKYKAPHKNRTQHPNLQVVRVKVGGGNTVKLLIATDVLKSPLFAQVSCGLKPVPKAWLKKATYGVYTPRLQNKKGGSTIATALIYLGWPK